MSEDAPEMDPRRYYDELAEGEWERLTANPVAALEFENTTATLAARLPDEGRCSTPAAAPAGTASGSPSGVTGSSTAT